MGEPDKFFIPIGESIFHEDEIEFKDYPFESSIASRKSIVHANAISEVDIEATPPTLRVENELIFIEGKKKNLLAEFARRHGISNISRPPIWEWILEPFLDTTLSEEQREHTNLRLSEYGLNNEIIVSIRNLVYEKMSRYNIHSMLWDWTSLGVYDFLSAMRSSYDAVEFNTFYKYVMLIALSDKKPVQQGSFKVRVYDNFHYMDESEAYTHGEFGSYNGALRAAQKIVLDFLRDAWKPGITTDELISLYCMFGDEPVILAEDIKLYPHFSARDFAQLAAESVRREMESTSNN